MRGWQATLAIVAASCGYPQPAAIDAAIAVADAPSRPTATQHITNDVDLLFVVDNSASIIDKQTVLANDFASLITAFDAFPSGRPDLHIGFVDTTVDIGAAGFSSGSSGCPSPDPGDNGLLQNTARVAGCTPPNGRFISDVSAGSGTRTTNYTGTLGAEMACLGTLGASGCGFEAPLEAMKRALDGSVGENDGFVREGAALGVMIMTDEDDCSVSDPSLFALPADQAGPGDFRCQPLFAYTCSQPISPSVAGTYVDCTVRTGSYLTDPQSYAQLLGTMKTPSEIVVAAIMGDPGVTSTGANIATGPLTLSGITQTLALLPSCTGTVNGNPAVARPGIRIDDFLTAVGPTHTRYNSACEDDDTTALTSFATLLYDTEITSCLAAEIDVTDTDVANPGLQPACTVTANGAAIPLCHMTDAVTPDPASPTPCAWIAESARCTTTTGLAVNLLGASSSIDVACALAQ